MEHDPAAPIPGVDRDRPASWERIDLVAATPAARPAPSSVGNGARPTFRLRRDRRPVLAALDAGGTVLQRRLRDVLVGATVLLVPAVALNLWVTVLAFDGFDADDGVVPWFGSDTTATGVEDAAVLLAAVFVSYTTAVVGHFAAVILIGERFRQPVGLGRALRSTLRRLPNVTVSWALTHWWVPLLAALVVGVPTDDVAGPLFLYVGVGWVVAACTLTVVPATVGEQLGPFAAVRRSWRLARLRFGACLGYVAVSTALGAGLLVGIGTLPPLLELGGFITFGGLTWLVQGVMVQLAVLVVVPLVALGTAELYVQVRLDAEGMDLVIDAEAAFGGAVSRAGRSGAAHRTSAGAT